MKYLFVSMLICLSLIGRAQQNHFIYIQADNKQPFYIRMDKKLMSSSASGYLIIPKLTEGSYDLSIGFPKNEWPEQKVTCSIDKKDLGYLLKNFGEKGWGLFNFQTMDLVMADTKPMTDSSIIKESKEDLFATTLANVVNDPSIRVVEVEKADTTAIVVPVKKPSVKPAVKPAVKTIVAIKAKPRDRIAKLLSRKNADSVKMVYTDRVDGVTDTINIVIPVIKPAKKPTVVKKDIVKKDIAKNEIKIEDLAKDTIAAVITPVVKVEEPKTEPLQPAKHIGQIIAEIAKADSNNIAVTVKDTIVAIPEIVKTEEPVIVKPDSIINSKPLVKSELTPPEMAKENPVIPIAKTADPVVVKKVEPIVPPAVKAVVADKPKEEIVAKPVATAPVYACKYVADGDEFMSLKKKMSKGKTDNEMLFIAHQLFLKRCVTSKQVERLSVLFTNDMAKYNLFDDAYHYTYDLENFPALQSLLTDDYYIKRFKAMLRQ